MNNLQPFLKWVGGKRKLIPQFREYFPKEFNTYYEPFVGAGAILFELKPTNAVINNTNTELINLYNIIKNEEKLELLIEDLKIHINDSDIFILCERWIDKKNIRINQIQKSKPFYFLK